MISYKRFLTTSLLASGLAAVVMGCAKDKKKATDKDVETTSATKQAETNPDPAAVETPAPGQAAKTTAIPDYPKLYCDQVAKIKLRYDVTPELSYYCKGGLPTPEMIKFREKLLATPGKLELTTIKAKHFDGEDKSEFIIVWGYYVAIRPFEVKSRPLYNLITKNISNDNINLGVTNARQPDQGLDSGLHLWSVNMSYELKVKATSGLNLESKRATQYNLYQVQSGNEEMGFGVETMMTPDNPDYYRSVMINLSFNDGKGYNDGKGGAIVMNTLHIVMNNRGFPATATTAIGEIGEFMAKSMYEGLKQ